MAPTSPNKENDNTAPPSRYAKMLECKHKGDPPCACRDITEHLALVPEDQQDNFVRVYPQPQKRYEKFPTGVSMFREELDDDGKDSSITVGELRKQPTITEKNESADVEAKEGELEFFDHNHNRNHNHFEEEEVQKNEEKKSHLSIPQTPRNDSFIPVTPDHRSLSPPPSPSCFMRAATPEEMYRVPNHWGKNQFELGFAYVVVLDENGVISRPRSREPNLRRANAVRYGEHPSPGLLEKFDKR